MLKVFIFFWVLSGIFCSNREWIRNLPDREFSRDAIINGSFERHTNPKSAINSRFHKNEWREWIVFDNNSGKFEKIYLRVDYFGDSKNLKKIIGRGNYKIKGNWVILNTLEKAEVNQDNESEIVFKDFPHSLLYHYDKKSETIIPMQYESGYTEKKFGVIDGVRFAYMEDEYFFLSRKIYTSKDFQSHAYHRVK